MTLRWDRYVANGDVFAPYYDEVPDLAGVRLRSVHLDGWAPSVVLRLDLPRYPDRWEGGGPGDTLQCQLAFSHVGDFEMTGWQPPVTADVALTALPRHRLAVRITAAGADVSFTANASVLAGTLSVFTRSDDGADDGPHHRTNAFWQRRHPTVPPTSENTYFIRVMG
ncbi:hypothetical protein [Streptomyces sp. NPDC059389]|uniref:hypothetical protein n=1 Tax=Streptomyces sp. NPDC059389 TaxID=3346818 RepID=UPI0036AC6393